MPRPVVPILPLPAAASRQPSRSRWTGRISGQLSATPKFSGVIVDALPFEPLDLRLERPGIEHHAVADQGQRAGDDARREQDELVGGVADHQRVAGVVPALEAHDHVGAARRASRRSCPCPHRPTGRRSR